MDAKFIVNTFLVMESRWNSSVSDQHCIPSLNQTTLTAHALIPLTKFPECNLDFAINFTRLKYPFPIFCFIFFSKLRAPLRVSKYFYPSSSTSFITSHSTLSPRFISSTAHLFNPNSMPMSLLQLSPPPPKLPFTPSD